MKEDIFPKGAAWMNGEFIQLSEARIPVLNQRVLSSDATYDVVHVWQGRFFVQINTLTDLFIQQKN